MRRYDDLDADDVQPNAECSDCGRDYSKADHDPTTWCDACSDRRDAHTSAIEIRMAKAALGKKQQSVVFAQQNVASYLVWLDSLHTAAGYGTTRLTEVWEASRPADRQQLLLTSPSTWIEFQNIAARRIA